MACFHHGEISSINLSLPLIITNHRKQPLKDFEQINKRKQSLKVSEKEKKRKLLEKSQNNGRCLPRDEFHYYLYFSPLLHYFACRADLSLRTENKALRWMTKSLIEFSFFYGQPENLKKGTLKWESVGVEVEDQDSSQAMHI